MEPKVTAQVCVRGSPSRFAYLYCRGHVFHRFRSDCRKRIAITPRGTTTSAPPLPPVSLRGATPAPAVRGGHVVVELMTPAQVESHTCSYPQVTPQLWITDGSPFSWGLAVRPRVLAMCTDMRGNMSLGVVDVPVQGCLHMSNVTRDVL